jgi:beta-phosphoglucomutase-like phosphatase (HAD superfamily)
VPCRAVIFDFNGTLSDDEPILYRIYADLFAEHGRPLTEADYYRHLAGLSDPEIVHRWLGRRDDAERVVHERVSRYARAGADGSTIHSAVRGAVAYAAARVPVAIVSGAAAAEIVPVVAAAGLADLFTAVVTSDDISQGKPHPEGYLVALGHLRERVSALGAGEVTVFEDTEAGILAAKAAGMCCIAVAGTLPPDRLVAADEIVGAIDQAVMERVLAGATQDHPGRAVETPAAPRPS